MLLLSAPIERRRFFTPRGCHNAPAWGSLHFPGFTCFRLYDDFVLHEFKSRDMWFVQYRGTKRAYTGVVRAIYLWRGRGVFLFFRNPVFSLYVYVQTIIISGCFAGRQSV